MKELILQAFTHAVDKKVLLSVSTTDEMLRTYYDGNGQRQCYLTFYSDFMRQRGTQTFLVRRYLTFTNKEDEGKQDAILFAFDLSKIDSKTYLKIEKNRITVGSFVFTFYEDVFKVEKSEGINPEH